MSSSRAALVNTSNPFAPGFVDARCCICGKHEHDREEGHMNCIAALRAWQKEVAPEELDPRGPLEASANRTNEDTNDDSKEGRPA